MTAMDERLARLRERFITRTHADRDNLTAAHAAADRGELRRLAHSLSGAGGIFGFAGISDAAADLERAIDRGAGEEEVHTLVATLLRAIDTIS